METAYARRIFYAVQVSYLFTAASKARGASVDIRTEILKVKFGQ